MRWKTLFGIQTKPHEKFEDLLQHIIDKGIYALDEASREELRATEIETPLVWPMAKGDWQTLESQHTGGISDAPILGRVFDRYPFAEQALNWHSLETLMTSGAIGIDLEFAEEPDTTTTINITFASKKLHRTLRQLVDDIYADNRAHNFDKED